MRFNFLFLFVFFCFGCGDDSDKSPTVNGNSNSTVSNGNTNGGTAPVVPTATCESRCAVLGTRCGAPNDQVAGQCSIICSAGLTDEQLSCLEGQSCEVLAGNESGVCGIGEETPAAAACSGYPKCEGNSVATCDDSSGIKVTSTQACSSMSTCRSGACEANACIQTNRTGCNPLNNPSGCCDSNATCYTGEKTICCVPNGKVCQKTADCCGADNSTVPTVCTNGTCQFGI